MASGLTYIAEFPDVGFIGRSGKSDVMCLQEPTTVQVIGTSSNLAAVQTSVFASSTLAVRVHNDGTNATCIAFGTNPTAASSNSLRIAANGTEYFAVPTGGAHKLSAVFVT